MQAAFYDDPRVLTVSIHQTPLTLFPGTGFPEETGDPEKALGSAVNLALPNGTDDSAWLRAFTAVVPSVLRAFQPQILVTQCGCDAHHEDPLADLALTVDGQRASYRAMHDLAHEICDGRWVVLGGGGYGLVRCVPRAWTHLLAEVSGDRLDPATEIPQSWRDDVVRRGLRARPAHAHDRGRLHRLLPLGPLHRVPRRPRDHAHPAGRPSPTSASTRTIPVTEQTPPSRGPRDRRPSAETRRRRRTGRPTSSPPTAARCTCGRSARRTPRASSG